MAYGDSSLSAQRGNEIEVEVPRMNGAHGSNLYYSLVHYSARVSLSSMSNAQSKSLGGQFTFPGTSLTVNRVGYGAMQLAGPHVFGPPKDPNAAVAVLKEAIASGVDHIDTSDFYGPHVTNQIIRRALHPYPKNLVVVTKVGAKRGADASWNRAESPEELRSAVDDNLRNLGLESLDIVNMRVGLLALGDAPVKGHVEVLLKLKKEGKIRHIGLSNVTAKQFAEARAVTEIVCVQNEYNLAHRGDDAFIDQLAKDGVAYVPFFPLGGFTPLQSSALSAVAKSLESTPMQVALAWLLQRAPNVLLIPGTSSVGHLRENLKSATLQLSPKMLGTLNSIAASAPPQAAGH
jgi:pyridoxine 4-dehydrogenase